MTGFRIRGFRRSWRNTTWGDRALLCEAMATLAFSRIVIAVLPFRMVFGAAGAIRVSHPAGDERRVAIVRRIRRAIRACATHAPFRAVCIQQGLAAQIMLRRRGVPSLLYFGAAPDKERGVVAHVWVCDRDTCVVGGERSSRFTILATFPKNSIR